jgi:hypothetical protein
MSETPLNPDVKVPADKAEILVRGREIVLAAPQLYVDVDVEADGIAGFGSMLALGAQSPTGESFYSEIKPTSELFVARQREFCEEHGLERERLLREAPGVVEVMTKFQAWTKSLKEVHGKTPVLTAFGPDFDASFVKLYFAQAGLYDDYPFALLPFDLKSLAQPLSGDWDWDKTSKNKLPEIIIPEGDFTHNALEDAQYQQKLHFGMAALLGSQAHQLISR